MQTLKVENLTERLAHYPIDRCSDYEEKLAIPLIEIVNDTLWRVATPPAFGSYHPVPWKFSANGTVESETLWRGLWEPVSVGAHTVNVVITNFHTLIDRFSVAFEPYGQRFTAFQDGAVYRKGIRIQQ